MTDDLKSAIDVLAKKITDSITADDALKYTQAALNLAHAAATLGNMDHPHNPAKSLTDEQEREAFEAWCIKRWAGGRNTLGRNPVDPACRYSGEYTAGNVEFAWRAWMARARQHQERQMTDLTDRARE